MKSSLRIHAPFRCADVLLVGLAAVGICRALRAAPFDAVPFGLPLPGGNGVMWEDPREIHKVVVHFAGPAPAAETVRLEYWGSRWPEQHLPKDREPGGGSVGWMELGNWYTYNWRAADTEAKANGNALAFTFRPLTAKEFPKLKDYPAAFRYTLKLRVVSEAPLPKIERIEAFTDSTLEPCMVTWPGNRRLLRRPASRCSTALLRSSNGPRHAAPVSGCGRRRTRTLIPSIAHW